MVLWLYITWITSAQTMLSVGIIYSKIFRFQSWFLLKINTSIEFSTLSWHNPQTEKKTSFTEQFSFTADYDNVAIETYFQYGGILW